MNISILLPFKENYSKEKAGAVSLFVKDTSIISSYKNSITIFGSTESKKLLSNNYINLSPTKKFIQSSNKEYYSAYVARWINERKPRWAVNLSKYFRQPKHRAGLTIFKPSNTHVKQKVRVGLLNWDYLNL